MSKTRFVLLAAAIIVSVVLATHGRSFWGDHGFVNYDDDDVVVANERIQSLSPTNLGEILTHRTFHSWLPVYFLSLALDHALFADWAPGYHLISVLLHALNAWLIVLLLMRLTGNGRIALGAGLLFAVVPGLTESVAWISSRKDVLSFTFMLAAMLHAYRSLEPSGRIRPGRYAFALVLLALALMTKGTALVMPLLLVAHRFVARSDEEKKRSLSLVATIPFFLVAAGLTIVHYLVAMDEGVASEAREGTIPGLLVADLGVYARYVVTLFAMPFQNVAHHVVPGRFDLWAILGVALLAVSAFVLIRFRTRAPLPVLGLLWFVLALAPFNNILPRTTLLMAERYLYIPALGAVLALAWAIARIPRPVYAYVLSAAVLALGAQTFVRTAVWEDSEALWRDASAKAPESYLVHQKLGRALLEKGKYTEALASLEAALKRVEVPIHELRTRSELSILLLSAARPDEALAQLDAAHALLGKVPERVRDAAEANLLLQRGNVRRARNETELALADFRRAASLDAESPHAPYNAGLLLTGARRLDEAVVAFTEAARRDPTFRDALFQLTDCLIRLKRPQEARAILNKAKALGETGDEVILLESTLVGLGGDHDASDRMLVEASRTRKSGSRIHRELARRSLETARGRLGSGDVEGARTAAVEAIEWWPDSAVIRLLHARVLRAAGDPEGALAELDAARVRGRPQAEVDRERAEILVILAAAHRDGGRKAEAVVTLREALAPELDLLDTGGMVLDGRLVRLARAALADREDTERVEAFALGLVDLLVGRGREGREALTLVAGDSRDALSIGALALRGAAFAASGLPERAAQALGEALRRDEGSVDVRLLVAEVHEMTGNAPAARAEYERVLERDPENLPAAVGAALNLGREGQAMEALRRLNELGTRYPDRAETPRALGQFYWERNAMDPRVEYLESAAKQLQIAMIADPSDVRTLTMLANVYIAARQPRPAQLLLRKAILLRPDRTGARTALAQLLVEEGRALLEKRKIAEAEDWASRAAMLAPELLAAILLQGDVEKAATRYGEARTYYERARALDGEAEAPVDALAEWYRDAGYRKLLRKDKEGAFEDFERAIALEPKNVDLAAVERILNSGADRTDADRGFRSILDTCQRMLREGKPAEAVKCARAAIRVRRKSAEAHFLLGRGLEATGDRGGAEKAYLEALKHRKRFAAAALNLGTLCYTGGRWEEAEKWYRAYLEYVDARTPGAADNIAATRALLEQIRARKKEKEPEDDGE